MLLSTLDLRSVPTRLKNSSAARRENRPHTCSHRYPQLVAKKIETIITLTDDIDGGKADRTVSFAFGGVGYEIDLSKKNANAFDKALAPYVAHARKAKPARTRPSSTTKTTRRDLTAIREWAKANGHAVSDRGRIAGDVIEAYDNTQG